MNSPQETTGSATVEYYAPIAPSSSAHENGNRVFSVMVQLVALCPLLAVSDTVVKAVGFSIVVLIVLPLSTLLIGTLRRWLDETIVLAATLLITTGLVTASELILRARFYDLGASFSAFLPLLAVNTIMAAHVTESRELIDRLKRGVLIAVGITLTLIALGLARELVGRGSLFNGAGTLLGPWAARFELKVFSVDMGFLLAMLPPGAFISLGLLIAVRNWWTRRRSHP